MMATNLNEAAYLSYSQVNAISAALAPNLIAFHAAASPLFEDAVANDRPVGNWFVLLSAAIVRVQNPPQNLFVTNDDIPALNLASEILYRLCYAAVGAYTYNLISIAQRDALLAAWNAHIGT
jgi:hypothetical protein